MVIFIHRDQFTVLKALSSTVQKVNDCHWSIFIFFSIIHFYQVVADASYVHTLMIMHLSCAFDLDEKMEI